VVALVVWLGFNAGGFFAGTVGYAAIGAGLALLVWLTTADHPFEGVNGGFALAAGALTLFAVWTLVSAGWSDATSRALIEFDRALLYLLVLLVAGLAGGRLGGPRRMLWGLAVAAVVISIPLFATYFDEGIVPRLPTAILSMGLMLLAFLCLSAGLVLDTVTRGRREIKLLAYLQQRAPERGERATRK
jgi:hypothetical protein